MVWSPYRLAPENRERLAHPDRRRRHRRSRRRARPGAARLRGRTLRTGGGTSRGRRGTSDRPQRFAGTARHRARAGAPDNGLGGGIQGNAAVQHRTVVAHAECRHGDRALRFTDLVRASRRSAPGAGVGAGAARTRRGSRRVPLHRAGAGRARGDVVAGERRSGRRRCADRRRWRAFVRPRDAVRRRARCLHRVRGLARGRVDGAAAAAAPSAGPRGLGRFAWSRHDLSAARRRTAELCRRRGA